MNDILTKGDVIVNKIKIGDIHYEFEYGFGIKTKVLTLPVNDGTGFWTWSAENVNIPGKPSRMEFAKDILIMHRTSTHTRHITLRKKIGFKPTLLWKRTNKHRSRHRKNTLRH